MTKLHELTNNVQIIGTLKSKKYAYKTTQDGRQYLMGNLQILCNINNIDHEFSVKIFSFPQNVSYTGIQNVMHNYKSIDEVGIQGADRIKVEGRLRYVHYGSYEDITRYNEIRGYFFNKLDSSSNHLKDRAVLEIASIIESYQINDYEGSTELKCYNVSYNEEIIPLLNCYINDDILDDFKKYHYENATQHLFCNLSCPIETPNRKPLYGVNNMCRSLYPNKKLKIIVTGGESSYTKYTPAQIKAVQQKYDEKYQKNLLSL